MDLFVLVLVLLVAVLLSAVLDQMLPKISLPLVQIALGILAAVLTFTPVPARIQISSDLFLVLFIAPLIFEEAKHTDKMALWRNRRQVVSLAVGLVIVATLAVGFYVNWLIPSIPLAAAFALGAALGPTDAVAVEALSRETGMNSRQKSILSAESLINDAAGIVSFQFALAAATTGAFSLVDASLDFLLHFFGGILVGIALAAALGFLIQRIRNWGFDNTMFHVLFEICVPFIIYLVADALHVSGILAVVAAGLMNLMSPRTMGPVQSRLNIMSSSVWRVMTFTLNGIAFVLLGAQLPGAMSREWGMERFNHFTLIGEVALVTAGLVLIRFLWVFLLRGLERRRLRKSDPDFRTTAFCKEELRHCAIMTFAGARGAITLCLILTIPTWISGGTFPERNLILFIVSGVIIFTLILASFLVPLLTPKKREDQESKRAEEEEALIELLGNVIEELVARQTPKNRRATTEAIRSYSMRIANIKDSGFGEANDYGRESKTKRELRIRVIRWEQEYIFDLIDRGEVDPMIGNQYLTRLRHMQSLMRYKSDRRQMLRTAIRRARLVFRALFGAIGSFLPGSLPATERSDKLYDLHVKCFEHAIVRLQEEIANPETATEEASELLLEYQRTITVLKTSRLDRGGRISVVGMSRLSKMKTEVERTSLSIELEQIQAMYEAGRISRAAAKRMRENVALMQLDLEDHL